MPDGGGMRTIARLLILAALVTACDVIDPSAPPPSDIMTCPWRSGNGEIPVGAHACALGTTPALDKETTLPCVQCIDAGGLLVVGPGDGRCLSPAVGDLPAVMCVFTCDDPMCWVRQP